MLLEYECKNVCNWIGGLYYVCYRGKRLIQKKTENDEHIILLIYLRKYIKFSIDGDNKFKTFSNKKKKLYFSLNKLW